MKGHIANAFKAAIIVLTLILGMAFAVTGQAAELLGFRYTTGSGEVRLQEPIEAYSSPQGEVEFYLAAGVDRKVGVRIVDGSGQAVASARSPLIGANSRFEFQGRNYYGYVLSVPAPESEGRYTIVSETVGSDGVTIVDERHLTWHINRQPPTIHGVPRHNQYQRYVQGQWNVVSARKDMSISVDITPRGAPLERAYLDAVARIDGSSKTTPLTVGRNGIDVGVDARAIAAHEASWHDMTLRVYDQAGNMASVSWEAKFSVGTFPYEVVGIYDPRAPASERPWSHITALRNYRAYTPGVRVSHATVHFLLKIRKEHHLDYNEFGLGYSGYTLHEYGLLHGSRNVYEDAEHVYALTETRHLLSVEPQDYIVTASPVGGDGENVNRQTVSAGLLPGARPAVAMPVVTHMSFADGSVVEGSTAMRGAADNQTLVSVRGHLDQPYSHDVRVNFREGGQVVVRAGQTHFEVGGANDRRETYPRVSACYTSGEAFCSPLFAMAIHRNTNPPELKAWRYDGLAAPGVHRYELDVWAAYVATRPIQLDTARLRATHTVTGETVEFAPARETHAETDYTFGFDLDGLSTGRYQVEIELIDSVGNVTQEILETRFVDAEAPVITLTHQDGSELETIASVDDIALFVNDGHDPAPQVRAVRLTGGPVDENVQLVVRRLGDGRFALEYPIIFPSMEPGDYLIEVEAIDHQGNVATASAAITYEPARMELLEELQGDGLTIPAVRHAFTYSSGHHPLRTSPLELADGSTVVGTYDVFATLRSDSEVPLQINDVTINPGETQAIIGAHNFASTESRLEIPVAAALEGVAGVAYVLVTTAAPNAPVLEVPVHVWVPGAALSADTWEPRQVVDPLNIEATAAPDSACAITTDAEEARSSDPITAPVCLFSWTALPDEGYVAGQEMPDSLRIEGVAVAGGAQSVRYTLEMFDHEGQRIRVGAGERDLNVGSAGSAFILTPDRDLDSVTRIIQQVDFRLRAQGCELTLSEPAALDAAGRGRVPCLLSWESMPVGLEAHPFSDTPRLVGRLEEADDETVEVSYSLKTFSPSGTEVDMGVRSLRIGLEDPMVPEIALDSSRKLSEGIYTAAQEGGSLGDYMVHAANSEVYVSISRDGTELSADLYQQGWGNNFNLRRRFVVEERPLWSRESYTVSALYDLLPRIGNELSFEVLTVPSDTIRPELEVSATEALDTETITLQVQLADPSRRSQGYDPETMGEWDVRIVEHLSFQERVPVTADQRVDEQGAATFTLPLERFGARTLRLMAEASIVSPVEGYEQTALSPRPIFITVLPGGAIEGELESRRLSGPAPLSVVANLNVERQNARAMDTVVWESRARGGVWEPVLDNPRLSNRFSGTFEAGQYEVRARITNRFSGVESTTAALEIHAYDVPSVVIDGPWNVFAGMQGNYEVRAELHGSLVPASDLQIQWSLDGGETWQDKGPSLTLEGEEGDRQQLMARARMLQSPHEDPLAWVIARGRVSFQPVRPPRVMIQGPRLLEVGEEVSWRAAVQTPYRDMDLEVSGEFILPDGSIQSGELGAYTPKRADGDQERVNVGYRAWIDGVDGAEIVVERALRIWEYAWPAWVVQTRFSATQAPADVTLRVRNPGRGNIRYLEGVQYDWTFPPGVEIAPARSGDLRELHIAEPGEYPVEVSITDERGNASIIRYALVLYEADPWVVDYQWSGSNSYLRAPLSVRIRPDISGGHPRDRVLDYRYFKNGALVEGSGRYGGFTLDAGLHKVALEIETLLGEVVRHEQTIEVLPNQAPTCNIESHESSTGWRFYANCNDPDGNVVAHRWLVDGEVVGLRGSRISVSARDGIPQVVLIGIDDAGAESVPVTW